jgi:tripartite-type tricarboxylate transporter receptor subunit TctC
MQNEWSHSMNLWSYRRLVSGAILTLATLVAGPLAAQSWPTKPVTIVVPYSPGGITDLLARIVADSMGRSIGQPVLVQNVTGAGGHLGGANVARAAPDGHTLLMAAGVMIVGSPNTQPDIVKYDTLRDLAPVAFVAELPVLMVVHPSMPGNTLREFTAWARANGDKLNCASTGVGTGGHLACMQFEKLAGTTIPHIPYKGRCPEVC